MICPTCNELIHCPSCGGDLPSQAFAAQPLRELSTNEIQHIADQVFYPGMQPHLKHYAAFAIMVLAKARSAK